MKKAFLLLLALFAIGCGPKLTPEEARTKWQGPIAMSALNAGICTTVGTTAQKVQAGDFNGFEIMGEVMATGVMIQAIEEGLAEAEPADDQREVLAQIQADVDALKGVVGPWVREEITSDDVLAQLDEVCADLEKTFEQVTKAAAEDGLPAEEMEKLLEELSEAMETAAAELE